MNIIIDKSDKLYKYLTNLGVEQNDIDKVYVELASNGRYTPKDVQTYLYADFQPSMVNEMDDDELEKIVDYYSDIKRAKSIKATELNQALKRYKTQKNDADKQLIFDANLKNLLYLAINYKSTHKDIDIQDLVQVANIGLIKALDKYKPETRIAFKDYVIYWVREEINKELKNA